MWNITPHCSLIIGYATDKIVNQHKVTLHNRQSNETHRKNEGSESISYTLEQGQAQENTSFT